MFLDNVPTGFLPGKDFVAVVSAGNDGNGIAAAHLMAKALGPDGDVSDLTFRASDFFVTKQRFDAVKATIASEDPNIKI